MRDALTLNNLDASYLFHIAGKRVLEVLRHT